MQNEYHLENKEVMSGMLERKGMKGRRSCRVDKRQ
jgi:hypothetical protein